MNPRAAGDESEVGEVRTARGAPPGVRRPSWRGRGGRCHPGSSEAAFQHGRPPTRSSCSSWAR